MTTNSAFLNDLNEIPDDTTELLENDSLGRELLATDVYPAVIKEAYFTQSAKGARAIAVTFDVTMKNGETTTLSKNYYFTDKNGSVKSAKDPEKFMFGFIVANALCQMLTGLPLKNQPVKNAVLEIYNPSTKSKEPTDVECLSKLEGAKCQIAVSLIEKNKQKKGNDGTYKPTNEKVQLNDVDKVLNHIGLTSSEAKTGATQPTYLPKWLDKFAGKVVDQFKPVDNEDEGTTLDLGGSAVGTKPLFGAGS